MTLTTDTNSITIERSPEMPHGSLTYWLLVRANCGGGNVSDWSDTLTAQILNVGVASPLENCVRVFPNPAQEAVNVQWTMYNGQLDGELHLFDVYGKFVQVVPVTSEITRINVSGLADGMYFVRMTTKSGTITKPFIKN